jgi:hypothetical protein
MAARKTRKNRINESIDGRPRPAQRNRGAEVRDRLAELGIDEQDVIAAVTWTRKKA